MSRQSKKRRNKRRRARKVSLNVCIENERDAARYDTSAPVALISDLDRSFMRAERLFRMCKGVAHRKPSRTKVRRAGIKPLRSRLLSWQAPSPAHGELQQYRRDRRVKTPYARDFIGPRPARVKKDEAVTVGQCVKIDESEHYFDSSDLHTVIAR